MPRAVPQYRPGEGAGPFLARWGADEAVLGTFATSDQVRRAGMAQLARAVPEMFTAGEPLPMRVLEVRGDGTGGVVEIPIAVETAEIDRSKTQSTAKGKGKLAAADLAQIVANFDAWPGPMPVGFGDHVGLEGSGGFAEAFFRSVSVRGPVLWAEIDLGPRRFFEVVAERGWRGFSIETLQDPELPDRKLAGKVLIGGVFTNRPALDVHFDLAATAAAVLGCEAARLHPFRDGVLRLSLDPAALAASEALTMPKTTAELEAELRTATEAFGLKEAELKTAKAQLEEANAAKAKAEERLAAVGAAGGETAAVAKLTATVEQLQATVATLAGNIAKAEAVGLSARVRAIAEGAIKRGLPAVLFEGVNTDPRAWFEGMGFTDVGKLEAWVAKIPASAGAPTASGAGEGEELEAAAPVTRGQVLQLSHRQRAELEAAGLDVEAIAKGAEPVAKPKAQAKPGEGEAAAA